jgi:hypothetical protein
VDTRISVGSSSQLSLTNGVSKTTSWLHAIRPLGAPESTGATESTGCTILWENGCDWLPQASLAIQALVWVISQDPGPGSSVVETTTRVGSASQLSDAVGSVNTTG